MDIPRELSSSINLNLGISDNHLYILLAVVALILIIVAYYVVPQKSSQKLSEISPEILKRMDLVSIEQKLNKADAIVKDFREFKTEAPIWQWIFLWWKFGSRYTLCPFLLSEIADALKVKLIKPFGYMYTLDDFEEDVIQLKDALNKRKMEIA